MALLIAFCVVDWWSGSLCVCVHVGERGREAGERRGGGAIDHHFWSHPTQLIWRQNSVPLTHRPDLSSPPSCPYVPAPHTSDKHALPLSLSPLHNLPTYSLIVPTTPS